MTMGYNLFDIIVFVIIVDLLHIDFKITIASMLKTGDKTIKEI